MRRSNQDDPGGSCACFITFPSVARPRPRGLRSAVFGHLESRVMPRTPIRSIDLSEATTLARILITEDDPDVRRLVALALEGDEHDVVTAEDGVVALRCMAERLPDLLLLDVMMPNLDGYGVLDHMASSGIKDHVRVMMVTAKGSERDAKRGLERGCDAYMTKPFDVIELLEKVNEMCSMSMADLRSERLRELDRTRLLSQLESLLEGEAPPVGDLGGQV